MFTLFWNSLELNTNTVKVNCYLSASSIPVTSQEKRQRRWLLFKSRKLFLKQHLNCRKNPQQDILTPNLINGTRREMSRVRFTCANHRVCKSHKESHFIKIANVESHTYLRWKIFECFRQKFVKKYIGTVFVIFGANIQISSVLSDGCCLRWQMG